MTWDFFSFSLSSFRVCENKMHYIIDDDVRPSVSKVTTSYALVIGQNPISLIQTERT